MLETAEVAVPVVAVAVPRLAHQSSQEVEVVAAVPHVEKTHIPLQIPEKILADPFLLGRSLVHQADGLVVDPLVVMVALVEGGLLGVV